VSVSTSARGQVVLGVDLSEYVHVGVSVNCFFLSARGGGTRVPVLYWARPYTGRRGIRRGTFCPLRFFDPISGAFAMPLGRILYVGWESSAETAFYGGVDFSCSPNTRGTAASFGGGFFRLDLCNAPTGD